MRTIIVVDAGPLLAGVLFYMHQFKSICKCLYFPPSNLRAVPKMEII